jgi:hypothetical protein
MQLRRDKYLISSRIEPQKQKRSTEKYAQVVTLRRGADKSLCFSYFTYGWFAAQPKEFFLDGLKKLEQRSHKCVELRGEYVE